MDDNIELKDRWSLAVTEVDPKDRLMKFVEQFAEEITLGMAASVLIPDDREVENLRASLRTVISEQNSCSFTGDVLSRLETALGDQIGADKEAPDATASDEALLELPRP